MKNKKGFVSSLPNKDSGWLRADGDRKCDKFFDIKSSRWIQFNGVNPMNKRSSNFFKIRNLNW
jgi:hypothetical protein